ncbi:MAG TPA: LPS export ABC transporter periplasmic protein LptC [candidate division Zixibacteria bacterium]|nr:LPS export ABC transporter periplasmic protein LptC [candidate division Zixibacteria bacterium]
MKIKISLTIAGSNTDNVIPAKAGIYGSNCRVKAPRSCRFLLLLLLLTFISCTETAEIKSTDAADSTETAVMRPDQQIRNARISLYNGANKTTDLQADYIEKYEKSDSTLAWKLNVYFYDADGKQISHLVADSGLVREQINYMEVFGNVVVTTEDSAVLYTDYLRHNTTNDMIETDKFVRIIQHGDTIQGYGLEADQRLKNIKIKKQVSGTLQGTEEVLE